MFLQWFSINPTPQGIRDLGKRISPFEVLQGAFVRRKQKIKQSVPNSVWNQRGLINKHVKYKCCIQSPLNSLTE